MPIKKEAYGKLPDGREASLYTISGAAGAGLQLSDLGARIVGITLPDRDGKPGDVALGYADAAACFEQGRYCGAICGRYANRIRNAAFSLNGISYRLAANNGKNSLHGGEEGFDLKLWNVDIIDDTTLRFTLLSGDGEEGYPGNLMVTVDYTFTTGYTLRIDYKAVCDADTVINLTNHAYFNLAGHNAGSVAGHLMQIEADYYTPIDGGLLPAGEIAPVAGTPFDFTRPTAIGQRADEDHPQLKAAGGYDHNFVLRRAAPTGLAKAATVSEPTTGRVMEVWTTKPGMQFYGGNFMQDFAGKGGAVYPWRSGFCLETQYFPNSVEVTHFPTPVLRAGQFYRHTTEYRFSTQK